MNNPVLNPAPSLKVEENKAEDPIQSLLRQLGNQSKVMMQSDSGDSLWGAPGKFIMDFKRDMLCKGL